MLSFLRSVLNYFSAPWRVAPVSLNNYECIDIPNAEVAPGDFHIDYNECLDCGVCSDEAPGNILLSQSNGTILYKQPETAEEVDQLIEAMRVCCVDPIHYSGDDPEVIRKIKELLPVQSVNKILCSKRGTL